MKPRYKPNSMLYGLVSASREAHTVNNLVHAYTFVKHVDIQQCVYIIYIYICATQPYKETRNTNAFHLSAQFCVTII